jgi:hypothetical protein
VWEGRFRPIFDFRWDSPQEQAALLVTLPLRHFRPVDHHPVDRPPPDQDRDLHPALSLFPLMHRERPQVPLLQESRPAFLIQVRFLELVFPQADR